MTHKLTIFEMKLKKFTKLNIDIIFILQVKSILEQSCIFVPSLQKNNFGIFEKKNWTNFLAVVIR
jgi:hypothetical protein